MEMLRYPVLLFLIIHTTLPKRYGKYLVHFSAHGDHCVMACRADDVSGQYVLLLCISIGYKVH
eukprot:m.291395 g.291395  ORF g.291395 m.291395 type:complete len:63 (+) comp40725_c0_seq42:734-922(+)